MTPERETPAERATPRCAIEPLRHTFGDGRSAVLRSLAPGDEDLIADFFASLTARDIYYFFPLDDAAARSLARDAGRDPACRLVAVGDRDGQERILGYMFLDWGREYPPTFGACLRGDAQSGGLGRAMIEHLLRTAADCGVEQVQLTVHADNWRALRLYQRAGFRLTGEFILQHQGAKQYRMVADVRTRPALLESPTIVARGGLGIGMAAVRVQDAIEAAVVRRPLIVDRPMEPSAYTIVVCDLAAPMERPFEAAIPHALLSGEGPGWIVSLDERHLLIGGIGAAAVDRAARVYGEMVAAHPSAGRPAEAGAQTAPPSDWLPFVGLCQQC